MASAFMAGFGKGFIDTFTHQRDQRRQEESDLFKMQFQELSKSRDELRKTKATQAKIARQAEILAGGDAEMAKALYDIGINFDSDRMTEVAEGNRVEILQAQKDSNAVNTGQAPMNPKSNEKLVNEAISTVYDNANVGSGSRRRVNKKLRQVFGDEDFEQMMTGKTGFNPFPDNPNVNYRILPDPNKIDNIPNYQTTFYLYNQAVEKYGPNSPEAKRFGPMLAANEAAMAASAHKEALANGNSMTRNFMVTDKNGTLHLGWGEYIGDDANGNMIISSKNGNIVIDNVNATLAPEGINEDITHMFDKMGPEWVEYNGYNAALASVVETSGTVISMVDPAKGGNPEILNSAVALTGRVVGITRTLGIGGNIIEEIFNGDNTGKTDRDNKTTAQKLFNSFKGKEAEVAQASKKLEDIIFSDKVQNLAEKQAAFNAYMVLQTYRVAALEGQKGRDATQRDIELISQVVGSSDKLDTFLQVQHTVMNGYLNKGETMYDQLTKNPQIQSFKVRYEGMSPSLGLVSTRDYLADRVRQNPNNKSLKEGLMFLERTPESFMTEQNLNQVQEQDNQQNQAAQQGWDNLQRNPELVGRLKKQALEISGIQDPEDRQKQMNLLMEAIDKRYGPGVGRLLLGQGE